MLPVARVDQSAVALLPAKTPRVDGVIIEAKEGVVGNDAQRPMAGLGPDTMALLPQDPRSWQTAMWTRNSTAFPLGPSDHSLQLNGVYTGTLGTEHLGSLIDLYV